MYQIDHKRCGNETIRHPLLQIDVIRDVVYVTLRETDISVKILNLMHRRKICVKILISVGIYIIVINLKKLQVRI